MKSVKFENPKKLNLNKKNISVLSKKQSSQVIGGDDTGVGVSGNGVWTNKQ